MRRSLLSLGSLSTVRCVPSTVHSPASTFHSLVSTFHRQPSTARRRNGRDPPLSRAVGPGASQLQFVLPRLAATELS